MENVDNILVIASSNDTKALNKIYKYFYKNDTPIWKCIKNKHFFLNKALSINLRLKSIKNGETNKDSFKFNPLKLQRMSPYLLV